MSSNYLFIAAIVFSLIQIRASADEFIQVEGFMLGYQPAIADGVRVTVGEKRKRIAFEPAERCLHHVQTERTGPPTNGIAINFRAENVRDARIKLRGLVEQEWLHSPSSLAASYYRDNLATEPPENVVQFLFVPMVLAPRPVSVVRTEWTPKAKEILAKEGWPGLERYCGTHFVETVGEEAFVIYSVRVEFPSVDARVRFDRTRNASINMSPALVLSNLYRMNQRFEFAGPGGDVVLDILQVGGRERDVERLREELGGGESIQIQSEIAPGSTLTRARQVCNPGSIESCQKLAQLFLDFQFRRLNFNGERPAFSPFRYRMAPLVYVNSLVNSARVPDPDPEQDLQRSPNPSTSGLVHR